MFVQKRALQKIWQPSHSREDGSLFGGEKNPDYRETINTELCFFPICSKLHYFCTAELQACNGPITQFPITLSTHTHFKKNTVQAISNVSKSQIFEIDDRLGGQISEISGLFNIKPGHY